MRFPSVLTLALVASLSAISAPLAAADLDAAVDRIASSFNESSARDLRQALCAKKKVWLGVPAVHDEEGFLGADQVYYLFQSFFEKNRTRMFRIQKDRIERSEGSAFVTAEWRYQSSGEIHSTRLAITLTEENGRWVVTKIRVARS